MLDLDLAALNDRLFSAFDPDDADLPVLVANQPAQAVDETRPWCRWTISPGASQAVTTGPTALYHQLGTATLKVFIPKGHGISPGYDVRAKFDQLFRAWKSPDTRLRVYKITSTNPAPREEEPAQINCTIFWESRRAPPLPPIFDFSAGVLPEGASVSRATPATYISGNGSIQTAGPNMPRFEYEASTLTLRGLLIEPAATNHFRQSQAINLSPNNSASGATVVADCLTSPDGTMNADFIRSFAGTGNQFIYQTPTLPAGSYTYSFFVKTGGYDRFALLAQAGDGLYPYAVFNMATGTAAIFGSEITATGMQAYPNGWHRVWATWTTSAGPRQAGVLAMPGDSYGYTGDGVSGGFAWQGQIETGDKPSSAILTGSGTVTRAADTVILDWASRGIADGTKTVRYTFDDGTTQDVLTTITGGVSAVPTNLNRQWLMKAEFA